MYHRALTPARTLPSPHHSRVRTGAALAAALAVLTTWGTAVDAHGADYGTSDSLKAARKAFLEPVPNARLMTPALAICNRAGLRCPSPVAHGGGYLPPDTLTADVPHLRFHLILDDIEHTPVAGGGLSSASVTGEWSATSGTANHQGPGGSPVFVAPGPGETWGFNTWMYQGVEYNGCLGGTQDFDIELETTIIDGGPVGSIALSDGVSGTGYYVFEYTVRATGADGEVSDYTFRGEAHLFCSGDTSVI